MPALSSCYGVAAATFEQARLPNGYPECPNSALLRSGPHELHPAVGACVQGKQRRGGPLWAGCGRCAAVAAGALRIRCSAACLLTASLTFHRPRRTALPSPQIVDHSTETSVQLLNSVKSLFPPHLATLRGVQWAQPHVRHRCTGGVGGEGGTGGGQASQGCVASPLLHLAVAVPDPGSPPVPLRRYPCLLPPCRATGSCWESPTMPCTCASWAPSCRATWPPTWRSSRQASGAAVACSCPPAVLVLCFWSRLHGCRPCCSCPSSCCCCLSCRMNL